MANLNLNLSGMQDENVRKNFQNIQDFVNNLGNSAKKFQVIGISATANVAGAKLAHSLGTIPQDAFSTRLIAPSAAKLTFVFDSFTNEFIFYTITGLADGESLSANVFVGNMTDLADVCSKALAAETGDLA